MKTKKEIKEEMEELTERLNEKGNNCYNEFDEVLNDTHELFKVAGLLFSPSEILRKCDEIAYRRGYNDWINEEINNIEIRLEELKEKLEEVKQ